MRGVLNLSRKSTLILLVWGITKMKFNLNYIFVLLFLTLLPGILFSHSGHNYNAKGISETKFTYISNYESFLSEYSKYVSSSQSSCNCCYGEVCFGFDYKCNPYDCDDKEMNCHIQCSQSESGSSSLPATTYSIPKVTVSFSNIKTSETTSVLKSFNIFSFYTPDKIALPIYISIQVLLI